MQNPEIFWPFLVFIMVFGMAGLYCMLVSFNLIRLLIGTEILIKAVTLLLVLAGYLNGNTATAQALVITLIVIEVVIMVVAGGVVLHVFRQKRSIRTTELRELKG
jgi:NADH-quinone oxidoreductase subunit K